MSPDFFYSSYMRYRADTDAVATWLLNTAMGRGYTFTNNLNNAETTIKGPRLKGKARALARASHPAAGIHEKPVKAAYRITIGDFIYLAKFISKANRPRVKVPRHIVLQLQQAIKIRKSHQAWYESRCTEAAEPMASEDGHAYFVKTLESVMEILRPIMPEASPTIHEDANVGSSPLANMFEHLVVEETMETASHIKVEPKLSTPAKVRAIVESTEAGRKHEASVASVFLSRDAHRPRGVVQKIWKDYHEGNVGLVAASIMTNTAIDFCRKLQEDFKKAFPGQENLYERACAYYIFLEDTMTLDPSTVQSDGPCLATMHRILERFVNDIKDDPPDELPTVSSAYMEPYQKDTSANEKSGRSEDNFDLHYGLMMGVLPEICALIRATTSHCDWLPAEDESIRAMRHLLSHKTQTLWVTFAFQVLLDIRHIMREDITWAFDDLCQGSDMIIPSVENVLQFNVDVEVTRFCPTQDQLLSQFLNSVRLWTEKDVVCMMIDQARGPGGAPNTRHVPPYYLLKRHPLWCGMLLYHFRMRAHESTINMANSWSCILAVAHLYNSLRRSGLLACQWKDMEHVISMHGTENLFVGAAPTTFKDCMLRFALAAGMRASEFARNRYRNEAKLSSFKRRLLKQLTPVSNLFKGRYCHGDGRTSLGPSDVIKALRQKASEEDTDVYQMSPDFDVCDIIEKLGLAIERETTQMTFNHFEMHILCSKMLRQLHVAVGPNITDWLEAYRDDRFLTEIVLRISMEEVKNFPIAYKAGELMTTFVARYGDLALRDTRTICAVAASRRASASGGVVDHGDASHPRVL